MAKKSLILVDIPEGGTAEVSFLEGEGHSAVICHGPGETTCPLLTGQECLLAEKAHGILFHLDLDRPQHRTILERYKEVLREDVPIRVVTTSDQARQYASLLAGVQVWTHEPGAGDLDGFVAQVEAADRFEGSGTV
jgi:hypothetical protein